MSVMERLSTYENFRQWTFDRPEPGEKLPESHRERYPWPTDDGPWNHEPDKIQWIDPETGLDCLMVRNAAGAWCGYVGIQPEHPFYGTHYGRCSVKCETDGRTMGDIELPESVPMPDILRDREIGCDDYSHHPESHIEVHGGITFSDFCQPGEPVDGICHVAGPGREDKVWWFGFDCGHSFDLLPRMKEWERKTFADRPDLHSPFNGTYRDVEYVVNEVTGMAKQLAEIK